MLYVFLGTDYVLFFSTYTYMYDHMQKTHFIENGFSSKADIPKKSFNKNKNLKSTTFIE